MNDTSSNDSKYSHKSLPFEFQAFPHHPRIFTTTRDTIVHSEVDIFKKLRLPQTVTLMIEMSLKIPTSK